MEVIDKRWGKRMGFWEWLRYVRTPNIWPKRWQDRLFQGHVHVGPLTIYGANAMHWAINLKVRGTYWCYHPTTHTFGGLWRWYFYVSPDATPQSATFSLGWSVE